MKVNAEFDINVEALRKVEPKLTDSEIQNYVIDRLNGSGEGIKLYNWREAPKHLHPNGDMPDICPVCGAGIESFDREIEDDWCSCGFACENCGTTGSIAEDITFIQYFNLYDKDGNRIFAGRDEGIDRYVKLQAEKKGQVFSNPTESRAYASEIIALEKQLFALEVMQAIDGKVADNMVATKAYDLYFKYQKAVKEKGTWMMAQEAAHGVVDILEGTYDDAVSVDELLAMDNAEFLALVQDTAETSVENALDND